MYIKIWKKSKIRPRLDEKEYKQKEKMRLELKLELELELKLPLRQKIPNRKGK